MYGQYRCMAWGRELWGVVGEGELFGESEWVVDTAKVDNTAGIVSV